MKRYSKRIVALLLVALATPLFAADRVRVRGHFRKDGTYVQPHYRTAPDSSFYNNWSTKGNFNPYTGEDGKVVSRPLDRGTWLPVTPGYSPLLTTYSNAIAVQLLPSVPLASSLGSSSSFTESPSDVLARIDRESRQRVAQRLRVLGVAVDPERESFLTMTDKESRVRAALRLRDLGHEVAWETTSFLDMTDMESRIRASKRLHDLGHPVDWKKHSFLNMIDMDSRIRAARRLRDSDVVVDWQKHSFMQLVEMERRVRKAR